MGNCGGACKEKNIYSSSIDSKIIESTENHPCYSENAHNNARMHIPVAPKCNIQCNYCNRKYDCVNETRPGVTSEVLTPLEALEKYKFVKSKLDNLKVVGIAGPGDALANWKQTKKSIELIKANDKDAIICLSTNGLMLPIYMEEILELNIHHITITINSIDPDIGKNIYEYVKYKDKVYRGREAAEILQKNQLEGLKMLANNNVLVKVNVVMIKGVNEEHIPELVKLVKKEGAFMTNIMPLIPAEGTKFEKMPLVSNKELNKLRDICSIDLKQMYHCQQCRADAVGLLKQDRSLEFKNHLTKNMKAIRIAVASKEGKVIDQHFGHVEMFYIYEYDGKNIEFLEERKVDKYCEGIENCNSGESKIDKIMNIISDCKAVLSVRIGYSPKMALKNSGIDTYEIYDYIEEGIKKIKMEGIYND